MEGQLLRVSSELKSLILPAFKHWIDHSNTAGKNDEIDGPLHRIYENLRGAGELKELVVAVDMALHAQHKRGVFVAEVTATSDKEMLKTVLNEDRFRQPWESE